MRIISWNVRGLNTPSKWCLFKCQIDASKEDLVLIQETKWKKEEWETKMRSWRHWNGSFLESIGAIGGLGVIWNLVKVT